MYSNVATLAIFSNFSVIEVSGWFMTNIMKLCLNLLKLCLEYCRLFFRTRRMWVMHVMLILCYYVMMIQEPVTMCCRSKESQNSRKSKSSSHHSVAGRPTTLTSSAKRRHRKNPRKRKLDKSRSPSSQAPHNSRYSRDRSRSPLIASSSHRKWVLATDIGICISLSSRHLHRPHQFVVSVYSGCWLLPLQAWVSVHCHTHPARMQQGQSIFWC